MSRSYTVAVVGATGMVGQEMMRVLADRSFPIDRLVPIASSRSAGRTVEMGGRPHLVTALNPEAFDGVDLALFSAGGSVSRQWCPVAAERGALVVDNSSAWRMDKEVPLCVPEVNLEAARQRPRGIVANPNCSTIQMVLALAPLHREARLKRIVVATYQAISGGGARAVEALSAQLASKASSNGVAAEIPDTDVLQGCLAGNLLMHWKVDPDTGYQEEELKMVHETRKILGDATINVSPTAVRVPVVTGHSEAVTVETEQPLTPEKVRQLLRSAPGIEVVDDFAQGAYPQPQDVAGRDPVLVGRIREDVGNPGGIQLWIVGDNLRKGAALNAVQIAEGLLGEQG